MATVTIAGEKYVLGDFAGTQENFDVLGQLYMIGSDKTDTTIVIPGARRMLEEMIANGFGADVPRETALERASEAACKLSPKLSVGSEFWSACAKIVEWASE